MKQRFLLKMVLVAAGLFMGLNGAWANDPDLENDYTLVRTATFGDGTDITCSGACAYTAYDTGNKKQQSLTIVTTPESAAGWIAFQGWTTSASGKGWWNRAGNSLYCVNAGRSAAVFGDDLTTGWLVIFQCKGAATAGLTLTNANGDPDGTFTYVASEDGKAYICTITAESNAYVGFCGIKNSQGITSISVYKPNKVITPATYTVKYQDTKGNTLKPDAVYESFAGADITLSASDIANITVDDVVYMYSSDDSAEKTVAEDNSTVVTVIFDVAPTYSCVVVDNLGNTLAEEVVAQGEDFIFYVPYYVFKGSKFYNSPKLSNGILNYGQCIISSVTANTEITVTYTEEENTNVVFFSEAENLEGVTAYEDQYTRIRMSNGKVGYFEAQTAIANLPAGKYTITASTRAGSTTFYAGETEVLTLSSSGAVVTTTSDPFTLTEATDILVGTGSNSIYFDYVIIRKIPEIATITDVDYATFVPSIKVAVPEGVTAYYVTNINANGKARMESVPVIPANKPVILFKEVSENTEVTFEPTDAPEVKLSNILKYSETAIEANGQYILADGEDGVGFYKAVSGSTIAARKAYLEISAAASFLSFSFDDETTGIEKVENAAVNANGTMFNLAGQRVAQPTKGLYIVNGKKVVIK